MKHPCNSKSPNSVINIKNQDEPNNFSQTSDKLVTRKKTYHPHTYKMSKTRPPLRKSDTILFLQSVILIFSVFQNIISQELRSAQTQFRPQSQDSSRSQQVSAYPTRREPPFQINTAITNGGQDHPQACSVSPQEYFVLFESQSPNSHLITILRGQKVTTNLNIDATSVSGDLDFLLPGQSEDPTTNVQKEKLLCSHDVAGVTASKKFL